MFRILTLVIVVFVASFYSLADNINDKAQLEKLVTKYEAAVKLSKECVSFKNEKYSDLQDFSKNVPF